MDCNYNREIKELIKRKKEVTCKLINKQNEVFELKNELKEIESLENLTYKQVIDKEILELGELIEGALQEEGYIVSEMVKRKYVNYIGVRNKDGKKFNLKITIGAEGNI